MLALPRRWTDFGADGGHVCASNACGDGWPNMGERRANGNAVLLPDGSILAIGGVDAGPMYPLRIERFRNGAWTLDTTPGASPRGYHATAALLPSGAVLLAGGDVRQSDYQVYYPAYFGSARPGIVQVNNGQHVLGYNQLFRVRYSAPPGMVVERVVLMRPSSVTHSTDFDQRYVELAIDTAQEYPDEIWAFTPAVRPGIVTTDPNLSSAPRGWYMPFVVTDTGVPSQAAWVRLHQ